MKVLAVLLALAAITLYVEAKNVVCGTKTSSKTVTVEDGDSYSFKTHKGKKYKGNTKCTVDYKMGDTCAKMSFVCTKFNTNNKDKKKCSKGDKVTVTANGKSKAYCKKKKPKVTSTGDLSVVFTSDAKKHSSGASCKVKCTEAASTGTTTGTTTGSLLGGPGPIETVTRVKLELFTGLTESDEPITFDGENVTIRAETLFDPSKPIKVVIHGWGQASLDSSGEVVVDNDQYPRSFNQLYMTNGLDFTVLGVHWVPRDDWNEELMSDSSSDAANTLSLLMYSLYSNYNILPSQIHMIGFSMGTVVTSKTAKKIQELGMGPLGRLTLLDPCPTAQAGVISRDDATFVEAIHTSSQGICSESPLAHVDYYPNGGDAQPCGTDSCSCPDGSLVCSSCYHGATRCVDFFGNPDWLANHMRAVDLYRESIGRPSAFMSWRCSETYEEFVAGSRSCSNGGSSELAPMGEHSMDQGRPMSGLYYLTTAGLSPFYE